ncbi:hypothetical protein [Pseudomonas sp. NPDC089406]|uniref:hypothetical protein n=1 Tax=Pseudomonas sp. NPDC089406 TaxID=3364463 RepID=UPI00384AD0D5
MPAITDNAGAIAPPALFLLVDMPANILRAGAHLSVRVHVTLEPLLMVVLIEIRQAAATGQQNRQYQHEPHRHGCFPETHQITPSRLKGCDFRRFRASIPGIHTYDISEFLVAKFAVCPHIHPWERACPAMAP